MNSCFALIYRAHQHGIASRRGPSRLVWLCACAKYQKNHRWRRQMSAVFSGYNLSHTYITVVFHLHGQTGPFTVWVNVVQELRLPLFCTNQFQFRKTAPKVWDWYQRWLWRNGRRISVCPSGRIGLPFQMFRCSRKFSGGTTQKVVFHLLSNLIFRKLFVDGKQPT